jgi:hypothetical protein
MKRLTPNIIILFVLSVITISHGQDKFDTSSIIIKKISNEKPEFYNISDTYVKKDSKNSGNLIVRVDLELPETTVLRLTVTDTTENTVISLIDERSMAGGKYRVRWEMEGYEPGRYWCEFTTDQFIYRKDFFIK